MHTTSCLGVQSVKVLWEQHKTSGAFQAIVAQEFDRALATLSSEVMQHEAEVIAATSPYCTMTRQDAHVALMCTT